MAEFQIHLLTLQWPDLGSRYQLEEIWPLLSGTDLAQALYVISEDDVRAYDWDRQEIWLSSPGMARIVSAKSEFLFRDVVGRAFVVTLQGQRLYGGLFYPDYGAAAIRFPVMHALGQPIEFLRIRPALGEPWAPEKSYLAAQCQVIANLRLEAWLAEEGLLSRIPADRRPPEHDY